MVSPSLVTAPVAVVSLLKEEIDMYGKLEYRLHVSA
jgi:hypothetical protein